MGMVFGLMLLFGFFFNCIFKGLSFLNIIYVIISVLILVYSIYIRGKKPGVPQKSQKKKWFLTGAVVYLGAIALILILTAILPSDSLYSTTSQINKSSQLIKNGDYKSAQKILLGLNKKDPSNALVNLNLGAAYIMAKKPDDAMDYLNKANSMLYFDENVPYNMGLAQYQKGNYGDALKYFESAIALNPSMVNAHIYAGTMAYMLRNLRKAIYHFENARLLRPDMPDILYDLGKANIELFEYDQAESNFNGVLKLKPSKELVGLTNDELKYLATLKGGLSNE